MIGETAGSDFYDMLIRMDQKMLKHKEKEKPFKKLYRFYGSPTYKSHKMDS